MPTYQITISNHGGEYHLGVTNDPAVRNFLHDRVRAQQPIKLVESTEDVSIDYRQHTDILSAIGPSYAQAQISIVDVSSGTSVLNYTVPDQPDCQLTSLETSTPFLDLDRLDSEYESNDLIFGGYTSYDTVTRVFQLETEHPFDHNALFFGVTNLTDMFDDTLVVTHAYYLDRSHRSMLGKLAFPGESVSDAFIYEQLEDICFSGISDKPAIAEVFAKARLDAIRTTMDNPIREHPYLYRIDGTILYSPEF